MKKSAGPVQQQHSNKAAAFQTNKTHRRPAQATSGPHSRSHEQVVLKQARAVEAGGRKVTAIHALGGCGRQRVGRTGQG